MPLKPFSFIILMLLLISCGDHAENIRQNKDNIYSEVRVAGEMRRVMWDGQLGSSIDLDTISERKGLYGLGPETFLTGELLINDGRSYVSRVKSDSTMVVAETFDVLAPFLVYGHVREWRSQPLPDSISTISELERYLDIITKTFKRPFVFKLAGEVSNALIHVQNLPEGTQVSSPQEAHQGQVNYTLTDEHVEIIGFFSTEHQGIFTHHDSFLHMHLMTADHEKMGHLDEVAFRKMELFPFP